MEASLSDLGKPVADAIVEFVAKSSLLAPSVVFQRGCANRTLAEDDSRAYLAPGLSRTDSYPLPASTRSAVSKRALG